jgi:uncharacterized membrane protein
MWKETLINVFQNNRAKCIGVLLGFLFAVSSLVIGFFRTMFIVICIILGYYIGKKIDNKESIIEVIQRILPNEWK